MVVFDTAGMTEEEVKDNAGAQGKETPGEGEENGTEDQKDQEAVKDGHESSGESDSDGGEATGTDGADDSAPEGQDAEEKGGMGDDLKSFRETLLNDVREIMKETIKPQSSQEQAKPREISEEEKIEYEKKYGVPYSFAELQDRKLGLLFEKINDTVNERFGKYEKVESLKTLSKTPGYQDASKYEKQLDGFLSKFDKKHHSDPEFLKMAVDWARGKNMRAEVVKAHNNGERNRVIAGSARPASSNGKKPNSTKVLTDLERQVMRQHRMSEDEYRKFKGKKIFERA